MLAPGHDHRLPSLARTRAPSETGRGTGGARRHGGEACYESRGFGSGPRFARRRSGYLSIVLLIGLVGGLALGVLAGARRTQSSFPAFLKSTNPSDLSIVGLPPNANGTLLAAIAHLPHVKHVESYGAFYADPIATERRTDEGRTRIEGLQHRAASTAWASTRTGSPRPKVGWPIRRDADEVVMNAGACARARVTRRRDAPDRCVHQRPDQPVGLRQPEPPPGAPVHRDRWSAS